MATYAELVLAGLQQNAADKVDDFQKWQTSGMAVFDKTNQLFRVMCLEENQAWNKALALQKGPSNEGVLAIDRTLLRNVYGGSNNYPRKWFVFNRPYMFGRQRTNDPKQYTKTGAVNRDSARNPVQARATGQFVLTISLSETLKAAMATKIIADRHVNASKVSRQIRSDSIRIKKEGGTFTLGLPIARLVEMAEALDASDIQSGGRLIPQLNIPTLVSAQAQTRQEDAAPKMTFAQALMSGQ